MLHRLPVAELEVSVTLPPEQRAVEPLVLMAGVLGELVTVTVIVLLTPEVQPESVLT